MRLTKRVGAAAAVAILTNRLTIYNNLTNNRVEVLSDQKTRLEDQLSVQYNKQAITVTIKTNDGDRCAQ